MRHIFQLRNTLMSACPPGRHNGIVIKSVNASSKAPAASCRPPAPEDYPEMKFGSPVPVYIQPRSPVLENSLKRSTINSRYRKKCANRDISETALPEPREITSDSIFGQSRGPKQYLEFGTFFKKAPKRQNLGLWD